MMTIITCHALARVKQQNCLNKTVSLRRVRRRELSRRQSAAVSSGRNWQCELGIMTQRDDDRDPVSAAHGDGDELSHQAGVPRRARGSGRRRPAVLRRGPRRHVRARRPSRRLLGARPGPPADRHLRAVRTPHDRKLRRMYSLTGRYAICHLKLFIFLRLHAVPAFERNFTACVFCSLHETVFSWTKRRDSEVSWIKFYRMRRPKHTLESVYGPFVQNACAKSNTWLTVVVAVGRYMVICRPLTTSIPTTSKTTFMNVSFRDVDQTTPRLLAESPIIRLPVKDNAIRYIQQVLHKTT